MARQPRLDAPGVLHHVMGRGIERRPIFFDDVDREDFLCRVAELVRTRAVAVFAWALMSNHFHLLLKTLAQPLSRSMRSLLTGYAGRFNRRHDRVGHLFQNRYKSIVCEEEAYFLTLVRYIHLNPLKDELLSSLEELDRYPYTGHSALVGVVHRPWQSCGEVLARFENHSDVAAAYREFIASGIDSPSLENADVGLVPMGDGFVLRPALKQGREAYQPNERVLGSDDFVRRMILEAGFHLAAESRSSEAPALEELVSLVSRAAAVSPDVLASPSRSSRTCRARDAVAFLWIEHWGKSVHDLARVLGLTSQSLYRAAKRGRQDELLWTKVLQSGVCPAPRPRW